MTYDRAVLVDVLVYHYRKDIRSCGCGWGELGRSWPEHVATVYEEAVHRSLQQPPDALQPTSTLAERARSCPCGWSQHEALALLLEGRQLPRGDA